MTNPEESQSKSSRKLKIEEILIELTKSFGLTQVEVASRVGVSATFLNSVINGKEEGGKQFCAGLELLKRVIELENQPPPKTDRELILELTERLAALEKRMPELVFNPQLAPNRLNETAPKAPVSSTEPSPADLLKFRRGLEILGVLKAQP